MKKFNGIYIGKVVQNNDPLKIGRVKVFCPHISATLYTNWNSSSADKSFDYLGKNFNETISDNIDKIKDITPWAIPASPIIGESGNSYFNAHDNTSGFGDGNDSRKDKDALGDKPSKVLEDTPSKDHFDNDYIPKSYSNCAKGSFGIPKVDSNVFIFFHDGDIMYPVYFAMAYNELDWKSIFDAENYPDKFENYSKRDEPEYNNDYKSKWVFNQKGASLEIDNTDKLERFVLTHYDGSFIEILKDVFKTFVQKDEFKLVMNDVFKTITNDENTYVGNDVNKVIENDATIQINNDRILNIGRNDTVTIEGNCNIVIKGNANITVDGTYGVSSGGKMTFTAPEVEFVKA